MQRYDSVNNNQHTGFEASLPCTTIQGEPTKETLPTRPTLILSSFSRFSLQKFTKVSTSMGGQSIDGYLTHELVSTFGCYTHPSVRHLLTNTPWSLELEQVGHILYEQVFFGGYAIFSSQHIKFSLLFQVLLAGLKKKKTSPGGAKSTQPNTTHTKLAGLFVSNLS